jgi:hypothetical protein
MGEEDAEGGAVWVCSWRTAGDWECRRTVQVENVRASWQTEMDTCGRDDDDDDDARRAEASVWARTRSAVE